ncbi:MAG TPA: hypothetical protein ENN34_04380 [Deltaproteobacteria bacterium]|nr:hypothetical protein [Deltaproteobacteria bacterium]
MLNSLRNPILSLVIAAFFTLFVTSPATAALIPSLYSSSCSDLSEISSDIDTIQQALESRLVQEKLLAYGLCPEDVSARISAMSPSQLHLLAQASQDVLAGGDSGIGAIIGVLVIIILIIIILKLLDKEIIIK